MCPLARMTNIITRPHIHFRFNDRSYEEEKVITYHRYVDDGVYNDNDDDDSFMMMVIDAGDQILLPPSITCQPQAMFYAATPQLNRV